MSTYTDFFVASSGYQTSTAFTAGGSEAAQSDAATLVFIFFGVGLARAWGVAGPARRRSA